MFHIANSYANSYALLDLILQYYNGSLNFRLI